MVSTIAAYALLLSGQSLTVDIPAMTLKKLVVELGRKVGENLMVAPNIDHQIGFIYAANTNAEEVKARLAETFRAYWKMEENGERLVQDPAVRTKSDDAFRRTRIEFFRNSIQKRLAKLAQAGQFTDKSADALLKEIQRFDEAEGEKKTGDSPWDLMFNQGDWQRRERISRQGPGGRLGDRVLALIDPASLLGLNPKRPVVLSTLPTAMQYGLDRKALQIANNYIEEQNTWASVAGPRFQGKQNTWRLPISSMEFVDRKIGKVLLKLSSYEAIPSTVTMQFKIYDTTGKIITETYSSIGFDWNEMETDLTKEYFARDTDVPIELSDELKQFFAAMNGLKKAPLSLEKRHELLDVQKRDPLGWIASPVLRAAAIAKNENIVGNLTDALGSMLTFDDDDKNRPTADVVFRRLQLNSLGTIGRRTLTQEGNWKMLSPQFTFQSNAELINRKDLRIRLEAGLNSSTPTLEQLALLALASDDQAQMYSYAYTTMMRGSSNLSESYLPLEWLRVYGSLNKKEFQALLAGEKLSIGQLSKPVASKLADVLYGVNVALNLDWEKNPSWTNPNATEKEKKEFNDISSSFYGSILQEPTELCPRGIPGDSILTMKEDTDPVVFLIPTANTSQFFVGVRTMKAHELAREMFGLKYPEDPQYKWMTEFYAKGYDYDQFYLGTRRKYDFKLLLTKFIGLTASLEEPKRDMSRKVNFRGLPAGFRKAVEDQIAELQKQKNKTDKQQIPPPVDQGTTGGGGG